ncbi:class I SAM-dependent methyltransferase [Streptomyces sp. NBC_00663]|uniref:class I SAM-dependent DNA methyltransferase n=1 Tax=Streptomyces sp. NBC_00663 TaxID=2975801 RepID=UPI002E339C3F|nr:class I SAM-dependent methyltransferase [Streptomyces sp. NBC_00663]
MTGTVSEQAADYGRQFADFYDRLFPPGPAADQIADALTTLLPTGRGPALELGVGTGRIALPLARRTGTVVGVDASAEMLDRLREAVKEEAVKGVETVDVEAVEADISDFRDDRRFPLVYCVCSTLLLITDPERQRAAVRQAAEHLLPGGHLVIETHNVPRVLAMAAGRPVVTFFVPYPQPDTGVLSSWFIDEATAQWRTSQVLFDQGTFRIGNESLRLTTADEIEAYAADAGLAATHRFSDWSGTPYSEDGHMFIGVYRRPAER